jgi:FAD-dependent oxidoreductase domain-containing protein 1
MKYDIAIIGGGVTGSSIAYHLADRTGGGRVCVLEPDPTYSLASTPRASGGVRQLFSRPENILMSQHSAAFYDSFERVMAVDGDPAYIHFVKPGLSVHRPPLGRARSRRELPSPDIARGARRAAGPPHAPLEIPLSTIRTRWIPT